MGKDKPTYTELENQIDDLKIQIELLQLKATFQKKEEEKQADDLIIVNKELAFQNQEKGKRAAELIIANLELTFQNEEKTKRAAELIISNIKLALQNDENEKLAAELIIANLALEFQSELIIAKNKAEESDRLKTSFLLNISHEIKTPMNAIIGFSKMLDKPDLSPEKRKSFTTIIINSATQLLSIVSDILTISSIETKQEKINIQKVCINSIIVDLLAIFSNQISNQNVSLFSKQQLTDKQSEIYTDKTKVTQILTNLINNSIKFTHVGFIEFGYNLENNELVFYVKDSGIGIKAELHNVIFERFRQADMSIIKKYGGSGLGLSISRGFVELLGGKIWLTSEIKKGSTFSFTIPYKPVHEFNNASILAKQKQPITTILVTEDEIYNFLYIEELLIDMDYKLIHAKDGKETVEICKVNPNISLILMDIKMPIMDGLAATKRIKEFRPNLPIIGQSAFSLEEYIERYTENVFDNFITKPIDEDELKQKLLQYTSEQTLLIT